ncbi:MAG: primosomal protein N' [Candidatus Omnitrophica bacterium]|nr:primosomal protein N' [Candidatus Omnitrophota bacterium]
MIAEVAVGLPIDKTFHYSVPNSLEDKIAQGKRVWIPFGQRRFVGYVVGLNTQDVSGPAAPAPGEYQVRDIENVIDEIPVLSEEMLDLARWISLYYFCSWGEAIESSLPSAIRKGKTKIAVRKGAPEKEYERSFHLKLTGQQDEALAPILADMEEGRRNTYLLFGITASGKTELYLQAIARALKQGKSSICLVPEIALTPQTTERFKSRFGSEVSVMHSRLSEGARFREWQRANEGRAHIVIGPRSAIFSPVKNLGLVIMDEEHETSYKQEDSPRYHARDVALKRAELSGAIAILGSATPSLETYYNAKNGKYRLIKLTERISKRELPQVRLVDMRKELMKRKRVAPFSFALEDAISKAISAKGQSIIFLNRRGFSTHLDCKSCGFVMECKRCKSVLVYHSDLNRLVCHYCGKRFDIPRVCPSCRGGYIKFFGIGTQKVESELHRMFPAARISRMDTDSTSGVGAHERILGDFKAGAIDVLCGTQMIAKGLDFPQVTLVGVISADTSLNLPDFRASERTFDLLTQVAGRAGRGHEPSEVIIQTYAPDHYAIAYAAKHDYEGFYEKEIRTRRFLGFPPYNRLIKFTFKAAREEKAERAAGEFAARLKTIKGLKVIGPAPSPVIKLRGQFRWNLLAKFKPDKDFSLQLRPIVAEFKKGRGAFMIADADPVNML